MSEFINEFGKENLIIVIAVVGAIILALIIIVVIEKLGAKRALKKQMIKEIEEFEEEIPTNEIKYQHQEIKLEEPKKQEVKREVKNADVYYVEETNKEQEAKVKLEEVTKKLIEEDTGLIEHTHFETEQEEKSIISYEELIKASHDIDEKNDQLLEDEDEAAITLEELYQKHVETQNIIEEPKKEVKVNNPIFEEPEKKFKNSEVISPVFGVYSGKVKQEQILEELDKTVEMKDLEAEIEKTEEFLTELKRLKNKLD